ncbi:MULTISPECIES: GNAT family N-acetyltransferase [Dysgonomonas]|uniref:N-acetyltransferase domain-containing protein n=1 Tax=Dysgonomonas gadei ATCC BAA-286 TaxID=742766 RepID=F5IU58_9BACT|nr:MULTISPECIES: GNAT family N-acetyltransferase [Dysgonomonas]EGK03237.1 hypothetical protein HMPREF9455_00625 [Dysgonomonas gadei ATCC BAA-286]MBF0649549.1 GNAT family N-acetyltransferase [Dysgonomonas sp. GY75]
MKPVNINIIRCDYTNTDHLNALGDLMNAYIADNMGGGETLSKLKQLKLVDGLNQHPTSIVLLAMWEDVFCGLLVAFENFSTFTVSPMINIHDLIVLPTYRGKDIGSLLMKEIIEIAYGKKCSRITLEVRTDNLVAQSLYKKMGFVETEPSMYYWRKNLL